MVINFFGRRGCGKTTTIRGNLKDCRPPILIVDILGNYTDPGFVHCSELPEAISKIKSQYQKYSKNFEAWKKAPDKVICLKTGNPTLAADYFSACIWEMNGGTLILDEVDSVRITEGSCFDEFIRYGRNHNGDLLTGCRRPAELDRNITAAANKFYCFQTHELRDIEYFYSVFGEKADELLRMEKYSGLFLDYDASKIGRFKIDIYGRIYHTEESQV